MIDCTFTGSKAIYSNGGAIYVASASTNAQLQTTLNVDRSRFLSASATYYGSVIYSAISQVNFKNSYLDPSGVFESEDSTFFFSGGTSQCISGAPEGMFGSCTQADDCWSCELDVQEPCPPGTYASAPGTTTASECVPSPRGFWSPGGSPQYFQCQVGILPRVQFLAFFYYYLIF